MINPDRPIPGDYDVHAERYSCCGSRTCRCLEELEKVDPAYARLFRWHEESQKKNAKLLEALHWAQNRLLFKKQDQALETIDAAITEAERDQL